MLRHPNHSRVSTLVNAGAAHEEKGEIEGRELYGEENKKLVGDF